MYCILMSGASGLIGRALQDHFAKQSEPAQIIRFVRTRAQDDSEILWDPACPVAVAAVSRFDAVIHLAGESIVGRWTPEKKKSVRDSRVQGTKHLATALAQTETKPGVFICASAIGFYGNRGDEVLTEASSPGEGFLPEVCDQWEGASQIATQAGIRTVNIRIGLVLSRKGGALAKMLMLFKLGVGGRLGSGKQWMSWIHIDDIVGAIHHAMRTPSLAGAINLVSPNPVRNAEFTKELASVLHRPAFLPAPSFALRLALGKQAADELLLASDRVMPEKLLHSGYQFRFPELRPALMNLLR